MLITYYALFFLITTYKFKIPKFKILSFFGAVSFPLYLLHQVIGGIIANKLLRLGFPDFIAITMAFLTVVFLAFLIMSTVEKTAIRFIRSKYLLFRKYAIAG